MLLGYPQDPENYCRCSSLVPSLPSSPLPRSNSGLSVAGAQPIEAKRTGRKWATLSQMAFAHKYGSIRLANVRTWQSPGAESFSLHTSQHLLIFTLSLFFLWLTSFLGFALLVIFLLLPLSISGYYYGDFLSHPHAPIHPFTPSNFLASPTHNCSLVAWISTTAF